MKTPKFISEERLKQLEESISFLQNYVGSENETHTVGESLTEPNEEKTRLLRELGETNARRLEIIKQLLS